MKYLSFFFLLSTPSLAADWLCTDEASQRRGDTILACGVGTSNEEATARAKALQNAKEEFKTLCDMSDDCSEKGVIVSPQRTECVRVNGEITCRRLISFQMTQESLESPQPKLRVGMSKQALYRVLGYPVNTRGDSGREQLLYNGPMCAYQHHCYVIVESGKVSKFHDITPALFQ